MTLNASWSVGSGKRGTLMSKFRVHETEIHVYVVEAISPEQAIDLVEAAYGSVGRSPQIEFVDLQVTREVEDPDEL